jgi:CubicO group peptidase (beta-lactamase class C family)
MTQTDFLELDHDPENVATGYKDAPNGVRLNNIFDLGVIGSPAGGASSTGDDMVKFQMALVHGTLLSKESLKTLWTGVTEDPQRHREYGYGAEMERYNGTTIVGHGGGWLGITNAFEMYPDLGYTVVVLSNYDDDPNSIADRLREWLTDGVTTADAEPSGAPALTDSVTVSSESVVMGSPVTVTIEVNNTGATAHASIVDMEIKDEHGAKVGQQFTMGQKLTGTRTYSYTWTPTTRGNYTIDVGLFGPGWHTKYQFDTAAVKIAVN